MNNVVIVILAAGSSSRMGKIKQILPIHTKTILGHIIDNALASKVENVYCVLGSNSSIIKNQIQYKSINFLEHSHWQNGLSSTISFAVKTIMNLKTSVEAILFILGDQPLINSDYIKIFLNHFKKNKSKIIASEYPNGYGVPALFPKIYFQNLLNLEGEQGAKYFLKSHLNEIISIKPLFENQLFDIDYPEDYEKLK